MTRVESAAVWTRLCDEVLYATAGTPMRLSFEHNGGVFSNLMDFEGATPSVIDALEYTTGGVTQQLNSGMKNTLVHFQIFLESLRVAYDSELSRAQWDAVSEDDFNEYLDQNRVQARMRIQLPIASNVLFNEQGKYHGVNDDKHFVTFSRPSSIGERGDVVDVADPIDITYRCDNVTIEPKSLDFEPQLPCSACASADRGDIDDVADRIDIDLQQLSSACAPANTIKQPFIVTTSQACDSEHVLLRTHVSKHVPFDKHFDLQLPAPNIYRRREPVATEQVIEPRSTFRNLGVPIHGQLFIGGFNPLLCQVGG